MKANELRIGNYLTYNNYEKLQESLKSTIISVTADDISYMNDVDTSHFVEPIPLTEEWLLKFGFEKEIGVDTDEYMVKQPLWIYECERVYFSHSYDDYINILTNVSYVHQLQNLYFALTGYELTII